MEWEQGQYSSKLGCQLTWDNIIFVFLIAECECGKNVITGTTSELVGLTLANSYASSRVGQKNDATFWSSSSHVVHDLRNKVASMKFRSVLLVAAPNNRRIRIIHWSKRRKEGRVSFAGIYEPESASVWPARRALSVWSPWSEARIQGGWWRVGARLRETCYFFC